MKNKEKLVNVVKPNAKSFNWCGFRWEPTMEGNRLIHPDNPWHWVDKEQIKTDPEETDDAIYLYIEPKPNDIKHWDGNTYHSLIGCGGFRSVRHFDYGTFSMDIKAPKGYNLWPSFWLSGDANWPPEIDAFEAWSYDNNYFVWTQSRFPWLNPGWKTTNNIHYNNDDMEHAHIGSNNISIFKQPKNPTNHFINYKVEWFPDTITFYVNNKVVRKVKNEVCHQLVNNLNHPDKTYEMDAIINVWCENPEEFKVDMETPLVVKNFKYEPYTI